jgi:hypothetical protein
MTQKPDPTRDTPARTTAVGETAPDERHAPTTTAVGEESRGGGGVEDPPTVRTGSGEDVPRSARGVVPQDNPLGLF